VLLSLLTFCAANSLPAQQPTLQPPERPSEGAANLPDDVSLPPPADAVDLSRIVPPQTPPALDPAPAGVKGGEKPAAPRESEDLAKALQRPGDLNLHGLTLNAALFAIGEQWNINIVAGQVDGTVNGVFKQAPLREILDAILLSNGYNYRAVGKSLVVSKSSELGQTSPFFESATIPVRTADIDEVVEVAKLLNTPQGQVKAMKSARAIVVLDFPDRVAMIRKFVEANDGGNGRFAGPDGQSGLTLDVAYFRTQYIPVRAAEQALTAVLSKDGRVGVMEDEDRLVVTDYTENLAMIEKVLARVDQPRPQVRITALIYDISLQDIEQLGLNWNKIGYRSSDNSGFAVGIQPIAAVPLEFETSTTVAAVEGATVAFGALSRHFDINGVLLALQRANDARLLADPNVLVLENEEAVFKSVREIPIQQLTETQQGGNIGTTAFKEAGITLTVVPKIAYDGTISMEVAPEFSRLVGFDSSGQPIIDTRQAKSTLRVANRQTVVIGGLRQRDDIGEFNAIPYLGDMKLLGRLFRARDTTVRESELVVFIMPEIVECPTDMTPRQHCTTETIRCRLDQVPQAEGCPPCCRRLPPESMMVPQVYPQPGDTIETLPAPDESDAASVSSSECQFGVAGRAEHVRVLVADGRLRRLPATAGSPARVQDEAVRMAQGEDAEPVQR
jgi:general secretion pathway protein D